jgi:hypothetical protein
MPRISVKRSSTINWEEPSEVTARGTTAVERAAQAR